MSKYIFKKYKMPINGVKFGFGTKFNGELVLNFVPISGEGGFTHVYEYHQDNAPIELLKLAYELVQEAMVEWGYEIAEKCLRENYACVFNTNGDVMNITIHEDKLC